MDDKIEGMHDPDIAVVGFTEVLRLEQGSDWDATNEVITQCMTCFALVLDGSTEAHARWHARLLTR